MAECDAVIRRIAALEHPTTSLPVAVISRCTGLRGSQVLAICARDIDLGRMRLRVTTGKSRREKQGRTVPIAPALVDFLVPYVERWKDQPDHTLVAYRSTATNWRAKVPAPTLKRAWQAATDAGEVKDPEVWAPSSHEKARPTHAFRAAFQTFLVDRDVRDEVIDALVGYSGGVRRSHYVNESARMAAMQEAVALIPPIDWGSVTPR
jgi:integrase